MVTTSSTLSKLFLHFVFKKKIVNIIAHVYNYHSETCSWTNLKTFWDECVCKICDTKEVEDEHNLLLTCRNLDNIRHNFT